MDVHLAVTSKRDHRDFAPTAIPDDVVTRILDAGRVAGSARNRQPWRFVVARTASARAILGQVVYVPVLVTSAAVAVAIAVDETGSAMSGFDAGRAAQNMMLTAWDLGVASCPNGIADRERAHTALGLRADQVLVTVLSFGYPVRAHDPHRRSADAWSARAHRHPLTRLVRDL